MSIPIYVAGAVVVGIVLYRFMYGTETPHIKGLPEVPGLPVFGSLYELGTNHAKVAQGWAKKYGPVFQVRMGNKVRSPSVSSLRKEKLTIPAHRLRKLLRIRPPPLDHKPIRTDLTAHAPHLPQSRLLLPGLHDRYISLGRVVQKPAQSSSHSAEPSSGTILHATDRPRIHRIDQRAPLGQQRRGAGPRSTRILAAVRAQHIADSELRVPH